MRVAVAGGTGTAGSLVVQAARDAGHEPVVLARASGVDLVSGRGLDEALTGADVVVDCGNRNVQRRSAAVSFFDTAARNLVDASVRAGVRHLVVLSVVGIDGLGYGYYAGKRRQEEVVRAGTVPWTVLRATQFHEFAEQVRARVPGPVALVPRMLCRPVAAREVAAELLALAEGPARGMAPEFAGPCEESLADLVRHLLHARGSRRPVLEITMPAPGGRAMASGALLPRGEGPRGTQSFDDWLAERYAATARRT